MERQNDNQSATHQTVDADMGQVAKVVLEGQADIAQKNIPAISFLALSQPSSVCYLRFCDSSALGSVSFVGSCTSGPFGDTKNAPLLLGNPSGQSGGITCNVRNRKQEAEYSLEKGRRVKEQL
jgi:hypothetical protein